MNRPRSKSSTADLIGSRLFKGKKHFRVVLLGSTGVGKTCIVSRLLYEKFIQHHNATIEELHSGIFEINGVDVTLELLDTSGSFEFPAMRKLSIMTGDCFILVFSINDKSSFDKIKDLRREILEIKDDPMIPIVIIANKTDLCVESLLNNSESSLKYVDGCLTQKPSTKDYKMLGNSNCDTRDIGRNSISSSSSSNEDYSINDARCTKIITSQIVKSHHRAISSEKRGSIFNNGNSALEKCLHELSLRDKNRRRRIKEPEMTFTNKTANARIKCSKECSNITGRQFMIDDRALTPSNVTSDKQSNSSVANNCMIDNTSAEEHHHQQQTECRRRNSHQPNALHLPSAPRHSLPLYHNPHLYHHHHHQQHHHHHYDEQKCHRPESGRIHGDYNSLDMKVVEDIVSMDWGLVFVRISAKNDTEVSTAIFKALLSQVDIHLQELQCLPPQKTLHRLFQFRNKRRVSEDTKMKYRRTSCKVS